MIARAKPPRGMTLIEMMVACSIFLMILVMVVMIQNIGSRADQSVTLHDDVYEQAVVAASAMQTEFQTACLDAIAPDLKSVTYRRLKMDSSTEPVVNSMGLPSWEPALRKIELDSDKNLILTRDGESRPIARLGNMGDVTFARPTTGLATAPGPVSPWSEAEFVWPADVLQVTIHSEVSQPGGPEKNARYELVVRYFLRNQFVR